VSSELSQRRRVPDHDRGNSAAYLLFYFHENEILSDHAAPRVRGAASQPAHGLTVTTDHLVAYFQVARQSGGTGVVAARQRTRGFTRKRCSRPGTRADSASSLMPTSRR